MRKLFLILSSFLFICSNTSFSQESFFKKAYIIADTVLYNSKKDVVNSVDSDKLCFYYSKPNQVIEVRMFPKQADLNFSLNSSGDFNVIDSAIRSGEYTRFKIQFKNLNKSNLLRLTFKIATDSAFQYEELHLQPLFKTTAEIRPSNNELFIGERKKYTVYSNNQGNINISSEWINTPNMDYRVAKEGKKIEISIIAKELGKQMLSAKLSTNNPYVDENNQLVHTMLPLTYNFEVKSSRLRFLKLDKSEISLDNLTRTSGIEVQLGNNSMLRLNKTYRIESQEKAGGELIAELFTVQRLSNNNVICLLRPYNYHRIEDGYLYIKDGDKAKFITNLSITPNTQIEKISILHKGQDWKQSNTLYPGETVEIKLNGTSLHKAKFHFEDLEVLGNDSLLRGDKEQVYKLKVPLDIKKKQLNIYNYGEPTGKNLRVQEHQLPRNFDFVFVSYGDLARRFNGIREPILYEKVIKDVTLSFNNDKIDSDKLYGKQHLLVNITVVGKNNQLIEMKTVKLVICPSDKSPRYSYYRSGECKNGDLSLNKLVRKPTYDLEDWSRIRIKISHDKTKHGGEGFEKEIDIILKRSFSFDLGVSFPAGLLTIVPGDSVNLVGSLSGISMAMIGQFSFYHPQKINKYYPFKLGAGFLALNAFNFNNNAKRDVGLVAIASIYPANRSNKLSFPLFLGGGYFIQKKEFFFLVGPGIRVRF